MNKGNSDNDLNKLGTFLKSNCLRNFFSSFIHNRFFKRKNNLYQLYFLFLLIKLSLVNYFITCFKEKVLSKYVPFL